MSKHRMPTRHGNEVPGTYHGDRADAWDDVEKIILHLILPATGLITLGLVVGITVAEVTRWMG